MSGSSGLGCDISNSIEVKTVDMLREGRQTPLGGMHKVSKQILPPLSMLGWYTFVMNFTFGGSKGYLEQSIVITLSFLPSVQ